MWPLATLMNVWRTGPRFCASCEVYGATRNCWLCGRFTGRLSDLGAGNGLYLGGGVYSREESSTCTKGANASNPQDTAILEDFEGAQRCVSAIYVGR
jgi:hypothetical protein